MKFKSLNKLVLTASLFFPTAYSLTSCMAADLIVFNWGEYVDEEVIWAFEDTYNVRVKYLTFSDNESMMQKVENSRYDVVFPSDYAVEEMVQKNLILPLDEYFDFETSNTDKFYYPVTSILKEALDNLKNDGVCIRKSDGVEESCTKEDVEKDSQLPDDEKKYSSYNLNGGFDLLKYAVPYTFGQVGLIYNSEKISEEEIERDGYDALFKDRNDDGSYRETVLYDSGKDVLSMAMLATGHNFQYNDPKAIEDATNWINKLLNNKRGHIAVKSDEILDDLPNEIHDIAFTFSGDASYIIDATTDEDAQGNIVPSKWKFYVPKPYDKEENKDMNIRTNIYTDCMVVMKNSPAKDLAIEFVKFMSSHEASYVNTQYIGYTSTREDVYQEMITDDENFKCEYLESNKIKYPEVLNITEHVPGSFSYVDAYKLFPSDEGKKDVFYRYNKEYKAKIEELWADIVLSFM